MASENKCQGRGNTSGELFQTRDAVDDDDFEVAIDVFLNGADIYNLYSAQMANTSEK